MSSFCVINAINSIDKHSLREVECEIYVLLNLQSALHEEKAAKYIVQIWVYM